MKLVAYVISVCLLCSAARAEIINYSALEQEGYGDVAELLKSMTPEQRAEVMRQATIKEKS